MWLRGFHCPPGATTTLVCLPHAGGNAAFYRDWRHLLPPWLALVAVQYPGRLDRLDEPCVPDMATLAERVAAEVDAAVATPVALFGHSLGASVAYEVARRLSRAPVRLFVSGRAAPHRYRGGTVHLSSDEHLWRHAVALGGTAAELGADPQVRALALPALRNDYRLAETYRPARPEPVGCPVTAVVGTEDGEVSPDEAGAWADLTTAEFDLCVFPGGHFHLAERPGAVVATLLTRLSTARDRRMASWWN